MGYFVSFLLASFIGILLIKKTKIYSPILVFSVLFFFIIFGSLWCLFDMNPTSDQVYSLVGLGCFGYIFGYGMLTFLRNKGIKIKFGNRKTPSSYMLRRKITMYVSVAIIIYLFVRAIRVMGLLMSGISMAMLRSNFAELVLVSNFEGVINNYIVQPVLFAIVPLSMIDFFEEKGKKNLVVISVAMVLLYSFSDGGRIFFIYLIMHFVLAFFFFGKKEKIRITQKMKNVVLFICLGIVAAISINYLSSARKSQISVLQTIYTYVCGCMPHLSYRMEILKNAAQHTNGYCFFGGIIEAFLFLLRNVGVLSKYPKWFSEYTTLIDVRNFVDIGCQNFNSFVTPFYYFYADAGLFGVFIGSAAYGGISNYSYAQIRRSMNVRTAAIYMLLFQSIVMSMVRWQFLMIPFTFSFLYVYLFTGKSAIEKGNTDANGEEYKY